MTPILLALALSVTGWHQTPEHPWGSPRPHTEEMSYGELWAYIYQAAYLAREAREMREAVVVGPPGVTGTWLSPTEISVQADVPAVGPLVGQQVAWAVQVYRYPQAQASSWPEVVATAVLLVDPGKAQSISITLGVPRPIYGTGQVIVRAAHDSAAGLDYQASVQWPYWSILRDNFEACGTSLTLDYTPLPCTHLWRWSRAVGYDPREIFRDGFEGGTTARWERSVP